MPTTRKPLPKTTRCPDGCGRTVRVFLSRDGSMAQYECPECTHTETRNA